MSYHNIRAFARENRKNGTEAEKIFWEKVRNRKFYNLKFNRQFVIQHTQIVTAVKKYFIADFYCHKHKLIVEIDGGYHAYQFEYDKIREDILTELGYHVLRFSNEEVINKWAQTEFEIKNFIALP